MKVFARFINSALPRSGAVRNRLHFLAHPLHSHRHADLGFLHNLNIIHAVAVHMYRKIFFSQNTASRKVRPPPRCCLSRPHHRVSRSQTSAISGSENSRSHLLHLFRLPVNAGVGPASVSSTDPGHRRSFPKRISLAAMISGWI